MRTTIYVIILDKGERNGNDCYHLKNMGKGLHKIFKAIVNKLSEALPNLGESGSEVSYFIPELFLQK